MTARDVLGGLASLALMLGNIGLCLLFALYDRMIEPAADREKVCRPSPTARSRRPALGRP